MTRTSDVGFDDEEEKTLPPLPEPQAICERRHFPSASGDFRTYETTCAVRTDGSISAVRLTSALGYVAQFAVDVETAGRVARELDRQLGEPYYANQRLLSDPPGPARATLISSETDVFFPIEEQPRVKVQQEPGGDRIMLSLFSDEASLNITMQMGVARAVQQFLAGAASRCNR